MASMISNNTTDQNKDLEQQKKEYEYTPDRKTLKQPISFIRNRLSDQEIQSRLRFLDAEFVQCINTDKSDKRKFVNVLASITILDYQGNILLDTKVTPLGVVGQYVSKVNGFHAGDLDGYPTNGEVIARVHDIIRDQIIVGHDLSADREVLKVNLIELAGMRDLCTSPALLRTFKCKGGRLKLKNLVQGFFGMDSTLGLHTAFFDTKVIRDIYLRVEDIWEDTHGVFAKSDQSNFDE